MEFIYSDGGRSNYFKANGVGDCVTRAIANATGKDYKEVYDRLKELASEETDRQIAKHRGGKRSSVRDGVFKETWKKYLNELGWVYVPTMGLGTGITMHLNEDEIPNGILIVQVSKHLTCVKDGILYDTYDCTRDGTRGVYGYWRAPNAKEMEMQEIYKQEMQDAKARKQAFSKEKEKIRYKYHLEIEKLKRQIAKLEKKKEAELQQLIENFR